MTAKRALIVIGAILAALCLAAGIAFAFIQGTIAQGRQSLLVDTSSDAAPLTKEHDGATYHWNENMACILFLGTDKELGRATEGLNGQADAVMLLALDTSNGHLTCIAIPRETKCTITIKEPKYGKEANMEDHLCLAYNYGQDDQESGQRMCRAVSRLLDGIPLEYFYTLNLSGIGDLADAVGGVDVVALSPVVGTTEISPGEEVHLTGDTALDYVWRRNLADDYSPADRLARQKQFIEAFAAKALAECKGNPLKLLDLFDVAQRHSATNLTSDEMAFLASDLTEHGVSSLDTVSIPGEMTPIPNQPTAFIPNTDGIEELVLSVFYIPEDAS